MRQINREIPPFDGKQSEYHGFRRYDSMLNGCPVIVVEPKHVADNYPWIWRAAYFDHQPEVDLALLMKGFFLVFIDTGESYACPDAMAHWDALYRQLTTKHGFSPKPALEGLSIGGLFAYTWAINHPDWVGCIYADNPVCDFKSCPGGKGRGPGLPSLWKKLIKCYHFQSEAEALACKSNPIDNLKPLADAHIPLLHVCGDADEVVSYEDNTMTLKQRYEQFGGKIEIIVKKGGLHHPHGLDNPTPIINFILTHAGFIARTFRINNEGCHAYPKNN